MKKDITTAQKKKIYAMARQIGLDDDTLHAVVETKFKKQHISDLTLIQARKIIDHLAGLSGRSIDLPTGRKVALVTDAQRWKMNQLAGELGWADNAKRLQGFCKKYAGVDNPDWMTKQQAWRIIEGLKSLLKQAKNAGGDEGGGLTELADTAVDG